MFNSAEKFLKNVEESFARFGIQNEETEKGVGKDVYRLRMFDSIHDSSYVATALPKSLKNRGDEGEGWERLLKTDFIPSAREAIGGNAFPAGAFIVTDEDVESLESFLKSKGLRPTVYQIFPGHAVAGLKPSEMQKILDLYKDEPEHAKPDTNEVKPLEPVFQPSAPAYFPDDEPNLSKPFEDTPQVSEPRQPMPFKKKVLGAALAGVAAGLITFGGVALKGKGGDAPPEAVSTPLEVAGAEDTKYFNVLKEGNPQNDELLKAIAENPALSRKYLDKLASSPVGLDGIKNPSVSEQIINEAATSNNETLREFAAQNPKTRAEDLYRLGFDKSPKVRAALAKNPSISTDTMKKLAKDEPLVKEALLENTSLPPEILDEIINGRKPDCEFVRKMMANPCITDEVIRRNAINPDACVREGVAGNPKATATVLNDLVLDKNQKVRKAAFANKNLAQNKFDGLFPTDWAETPSSERLEEARKSALENPSVKQSIMEEALAADYEKYAPHLAKNKSLPPYLADEIGRLASGRSGLRNFINDALKLKTDTVAHDNLRFESNNFGGDISIPLRKKLNGDFVDKVYDPARLASIAKDKRSATASVGGDGGRKISSLDVAGNAPIFFSKGGGSFSGGATGGGISGGDGSGGGSKGKNGQNSSPQGGSSGSATLGGGNGNVMAVADSIVSQVMADILPPIAKSAIGSAKAPKGGWRGLPEANYSDGKYGEFNNPLDFLYKNSCNEVDSLKGLF